MADRILLACFLVRLISACTSPQADLLDGPVDYTTSSRFGGTELHVATDGSAMWHTWGEAAIDQTRMGTASADVIEALRTDITVADLGSLLREYDCTTDCTAPEPLRQLNVHEADGTMWQITVNPGISDSQLPAGLVRIFNDLTAIVHALY
jgi:hypothetical protein